MFRLLAGLLAVLLTASYALTLLVGTFISQGVLDARQEWQIIPAGVVGVLALGLLWRMLRTGPTLAAPPQNPLNPDDGGGVRADLRAHAGDLRRVMLGTLLIFALLGLGWGVDFAGDGDQYILTYLQFDEADPPYYSMQVYWLPFTGAVYGVLLQVGGVPLVVLMQLAQALMAGAAVYLLARPWGRLAAWLLVGLWWASVPTQLHFHLIGADGLMVWVIPAWALSLRYALHYQTGRHWLAVGAWVALSTLTRGGNSLLVLSFAGALLAGWRPLPLLRRTLPGVALVALVMGGVVLHNGLRYDYWGTVRGGHSIWFTAVYMPRSYIRLENGPATARLAEHVETYALPAEVYDDVSLEEFLGVGNWRAMDDAMVAVDLGEGWHTEYALLRDVSWEAFQASPGPIITLRAETFLRTMLTKEPLSPTVDLGHAQPTQHEVELVSGTANTFFATRPDDTLADPARLAAQIDDLEAFLRPVRDVPQQPEIMRQVGWFWLRYGISPVLMLLLVPWALLVTGGRGRALLILLAGIALLVVFPASMATIQTRYRMPFDFIFFLWVAVSMQWGLYALQQRLRS